jgi:hypothetical protein
MSARATESDFWKRVNKDGPIIRPDLGACWEWTGYIMAATGYGQINRRPRGVLLTHRYSYEISVGPIPDGLTLDHLCRNRRCVRPSHLDPVPLSINKERGESPAAINARKTHCKNGHPYDSINSASGSRFCSICHNQWQRDHWNSTN